MIRVIGRGFYQGLRCTIFACSVEVCLRVPSRNFASLDLWCKALFRISRSVRVFAHATFGQGLPAWRKLPQSFGIDALTLFAWCCLLSKVQPG